MSQEETGIDFFDEVATGVSFVDGGITCAKGISASGVHAGFRHNASKQDLALVLAPADTVAAGVFTTNIFCAAPVSLSREHVANGHARAIILNSGNANAATGSIGDSNAKKTAELVAAQLDLDPSEVLVASTGVIGVQLNMDCFVRGIPAASNLLDQGREAAKDAARAIMTTDTVPKEAAVSFRLPGSDGQDIECHIGGMAKGSGMIEPNMATMLAVLTTDVALSPEGAQAALKKATDKSFNCVTVDSDTSTNDTVFLLSTGCSSTEILEPGTEAFCKFCDALETVCVSLAKQIAADGEGATKLVTVKITGAADDRDALIAAKSVANSPLVKTAIAGHDANWGRIAMALGKSNARFSQEDVSISIMGIPVCKAGLTVEFDEDEALKRFEAPEILIEADLGCGTGTSRVWTCDLTHGYITINGDYRT